MVLERWVLTVLVQVVTIMGWGQNAENIVQVDLDCRPCSIYGQKPCKRGDYACMNMIKPETIVEKINSLLQTKQNN